jgi:Sec-independent protein secretion pathway component TatC
VSTSQGNGQLFDVQMPFTAHLAELRSRLIKSTLAIVVGFMACYAIVDDIFAVLAAPLRRLQIRGLTLIGTSVTEAFFTKLKISFIAAVMVASPVLLWQESCPVRFYLLHRWGRILLRHRDSAWTLFLIAAL